MSTTSTLFYTLIYLTVGAVWIFISDLVLSNMDMDQSELAIMSLGADVIFLAFSFIFFLSISRKLTFRHKKAEDKIAKLTDQKQKLERIAHTQSHNARSPIASILGLTHIYETKEGSDYNNDLIAKIRELCEETDKKIRITMAEASGEEEQQAPSEGVLRNMESRSNPA